MGNFGAPPQKSGLKSVHIKLSPRRQGWNNLYPRQYESAYSQGYRNQADHSPG